MKSNLQQAIFNYFRQEHGLILQESDFLEIMNMLDQFQYCRCGSHRLINTTGRDIRCRICKKKVES